MLRRVARGGRFARRHSDEPESPFEAATRLRPLRLVVDLTTAPQGDALDVVRSFAYHSAVEVVEYAGAPPTPDGRADTEPRTGPGELRLDWDAGRGFVTLEALRDNLTTVSVVAEGFSLRNIAREYVSSAELDEATTGLALGAATDSLGFDALVTGNPGVLGKVHPNLVSGNPVSTTVGCFLTGLYLRSRGDYTYDVGDSHSMSDSRSGFFWELGRALLPASWRWFSACAHSTFERRTTSELIDLGMSGLERFDRALRARDRLHAIGQLADSQDNVDEEIFAFDVMLLMLAAAFDVTARIATRAYDLPVENRRVGWRRADWRRALHDADQSLFELTEIGTATRDAIDLVAHMRNMVHGEALRSEFHWNRSPRRHRVRVPDDVGTDLTVIAERQGGLEKLGLESGALGLYVDPGVYGERVFRKATAAIDALMSTTNVERLVTDPSVLLTGPADQEGQWPDPEWLRDRFRLLAGLSVID